MARRNNPHPAQTKTVILYGVLIGTLLSVTGCIPQVAKEKIISEGDIDIFFIPAADMHVGRVGAGYTRQGNLIYVISGEATLPPSGLEKALTLEIYDINKDSWLLISWGHSVAPHSFLAAEYADSTYEIHFFGGRRQDTSALEDTVFKFRATGGRLSYASSMPEGLTHVGSATWGNNIYIFGGRTALGFSNRCYRYSPTTGDWTRLANMPEAKETSGRIVEGQLYVFGGRSDSISSSVHVYDIETDNWSFLGDTPHPISGYAIAGFDHHIWLAGGELNSRSLLSYDTNTGEFTSYRTNMTGRQYGGAVIIDKKMVVFGGSQYPGGHVLRGTSIADLSAFYPLDLQFNQARGMRLARMGPGSTTDGTYLYASNGAPGAKNTRNQARILERYDPSKNAWSILASGLTPRLWGSAEYIAATNSIYLFNGSDQHPPPRANTVEVVNVRTGEVSHLTSNPYPVNQAGAATWENRIFVFGGRNRDGYSSRIYEFDPLQDKWTRLVDMPEAKVTNGEVVDGILYVIGGYNGSVSRRIDAYDIRTGTWRKIRDLVDGVSAHATAVSGDIIWLVGDYRRLQFLAVFNTKTQKLTQLSTNMTGRRHAAAEIFGQYLYVFGGNQSTAGGGITITEYADISGFLESTRVESRQ